MELNCDKCSQNYHIPENKLDYRKVYFLCERCGHRIVIDPPKEGWFKNTPFIHPPFKAGSLIDSISSSFSLKSITVAFSVLYSILITAGLTGFLVSNNPGFFLSHPVFSGISALALVILVKYAYDFMLYLISLNAFHRFTHNRNISYTNISPRIVSDSSKIFFFSSAAIAILVLMSIPVYFFKSGGPLYAAMLFPLMLAAAALAVWSWTGRGFLYSLIAFNSRSLKYTLRTIGRFIMVENINIAAYAVLIRIITCFISVMVYTAVMLPAIFALLVSAVFVNTGSGLSGGYYESASYVLLFFGSIILVLTASWLTVLKQTLRSAAIKIMESNPGISISGRSKIIALIAITAFLIIISALAVAVLTSSGLTAIISAFIKGAVLKSIL